MTKCEGVHKSRSPEYALMSRWFQPTLRWEQAGPLIERTRIELHNATDGSNEWVAHGTGQVYAYGPTALVAAMRCYCNVCLGDEVEIPEELL